MTQRITRASSGLTPDQVTALRPHVVDLRDGKLATEAGGEGEFFTTDADVEAIFETHLPQYVSEHRDGPVPLVLYAHGGVTAEANGLRIAHRQIRWWLDNGAYPLHFVWETGLVDAVTDALAGVLAPSARGLLGDFRDRVLETFARLAQGKRLWDAMKDDAVTASASGGGARRVAELLGTYVTDHPGAITVHAVGHSAGSIFHAHLLPNLLHAGVERVDTISLLAPAARTDLFEQKVLPQLDSGKVGHLTMYSMTQQAELDDTCGGVYGKSLLYLVSRSFEPEIGAPILGLQESVRDNDRLARLFLDGTASTDAVWSPVTAGPHDSSTSLTHGGFDEDAPTMNSVARRILARDNIVEFPEVRARASAPEVLRTAPVAVPRWPSASPRKALCIGIDRYPDVPDRLGGCVADACEWADALHRVGFDVESLHDDRADRTSILRVMVELVSGASPGDVLVVQYSGHGTHVPDLNGDESGAGDSADKQDEALCPVDFRGGELLIDDDLGQVWDLLPVGVGLTLVFDSCHSGSANRGLNSAELEQIREDTDSLPRYRVLDDETVRKYREIRGSSVPAETRTDRELLFSACSAVEVAYETAGHGDFTRKAAPLVATAAGFVTNAEFLARVRDGFNPRQHPEIHGSNDLHDQLFLFTPTGAPAAAGPTAALRAGSTDGQVRAVAAFLRATADLIDPSGGN